MDGSAESFGPLEGPFGCCCRCEWRTTDADETSGVPEKASTPNDHEMAALVAIHRHPMLFSGTSCLGPAATRAHLAVTSYSYTLTM